MAHLTTVQKSVNNNKKFTNVMLNSKRCNCTVLKQTISFNTVSKLVKFNKLKFR